MQKALEPHRQVEGTWFKNGQTAEVLGKRQNLTWNMATFLEQMNVNKTGYKNWGIKEQSQSKIKRRKQEIARHYWHWCKRKVFKKRKRKEKRAVKGVQPEL